MMLKNLLLLCNKNMAITSYVQTVAPNLFNKEVQTLFMFYMAWVSAHYISTHIYTYFCTNNTFYGFLTSPFVAAAPHCVALRWVIYEGGNTITSMWLSLGTYLGAKLLIYNS